MPHTLKPRDPAFGLRSLAWASVGCGVASWLLAAVVPIGFELLGIIVGLLAIRRVHDDSKWGKRIASCGVVISIAKLLAGVATFAWVIIAFAINPVAH